MGCCGSTEKEEDQHLDNLRNEVALLVLKESPQEVILRYVAAFRELFVGGTSTLVGFFRNQ